jgi:thiol-disulfide isomerase/thioredoxin
MVRILKLLVVIALAAVLVVGLATTACCDGVDGNGNEPNGNEPNGYVPNEGEPDLVNGHGVIIDCEEYGGSEFKQLDPAPVFTFEDAAGSTFSLSDFQGKAVMLNFWTTTCGWCVVEMPFIQQVYDEWPDDDVVILTIDIGESAETVATFLQDNGISLPVLLDREAKVAAQYRIASIPRTFFIDKEGLIQGIRFGALQSPEELEDILNQLVNL